MKPINIPMVAFCYSCKAKIDAREHGVFKTCPKCGSTEIDTWGVEVTKTDDPPSVKKL
jgi:predicted RNA-binding Zn-ribbon protein involved in translation (DUF1610 family)